VLVLGVGGQGAPPHSTAFYLTTDGGASWRTLATGLSIASLATDTRSGRHVYAVTAKTQQDGSATLRLQRSDDGGATWTPVDAGLLARHMTPQTVWLRPDTGELLVQTTDTAAAPYLFTSPDGGATWTELAGMRGGGYVVAAPQDGRTWQVCRISQPSPNANQIDGLDCYTDGNPQERFTPRPQLTLPGSANADNKPYYFALLPDGTLLAFSPEAAGYSSYTLYRLPPNAAAWENLGPVPEFPRSVGDTPGNVAILWAQPTFGMPPGQGVFVAQLRWS
jgi:hypothetical protein